MSKDKHLKEREKLEAEISRSLSVVKMKEAHKQIEDIEKLRRQASIKSVCERISLCIEINRAMIDAFQKEHPKATNMKIKDSGFVSKYLDKVIAIYGSIYFDLQKTINIKEEEFNRLFPKTEYNFDTYESVKINLLCLNIQLMDMKKYCLRLL